MIKAALLTTSAVSFVLWSSDVYAQSSSETYTYDALGRLVVVETTGGQNDDEVHSICYDDAGNRTEYTSTSDGTASGCSGGGGVVPPPPPPPPPSAGSIAVADAQVLEGGIMNFAVTLNIAQTSTVSVSYATMVGTAGAADFSATSGVLTFAPGQTVKSIQVSTINDFQLEPNESFSVDLSNVSGPAAIGDGMAIGTIFDDEDFGNWNCGGIICN